MKKFSNSYNEAKLLNTIETTENVLVLDQGRHSVFLVKIFTRLQLRKIIIMQILINNKRIKFLSVKNISKIPNCLKYELVKEINYFNGTRNFVKNKEKR